MKIFEDLKLNKSIDNFKLCVAKCDNGNIMLYVGNKNGKILLKRFSGQKSYERFLVRSVILGLTGKYDLKSVDGIYFLLQKTLEALPDFHSDKLGE